jgi:hypothetical protein
VNLCISGLELEEYRVMNALSAARGDGLALSVIYVQVARLATTDGWGEPVLELEQLEWCCWQYTTLVRVGILIKIDIFSSCNLQPLKHFNPSLT